MEKLLSLREISFYGISSILGSIATYFFGGWSTLLHFMLICMALDYISGCFASVIEGKGLSSAVGFKGITKKVFMILTIYLAHYADMAVGVDWIMIGTTWFWIANELVSLAENYARMGLPFPESLKKLITVVKDRSNQSQ
ncbi:phage holin family protein [Paenibacillus sp. FSL H3-0333]|uniref:phage holin family protein n=1 Tax=Paenibacillus sp. FSL H3-0333 TaxID=2921373 RepID=UPI0030FAE480